MLSDPEFFECELLTVSSDQAAVQPQNSLAARLAAEMLKFPSTGFSPMSWNQPGMFEFILAEPVKCPLCHAPVTEKTLVDRGGIEVVSLCQSL